MRRIIVAIIIAYILGIIIGLYKTISIILFFIVFSGVIYFVPTIRIFVIRNKKIIILTILSVLLGLVCIKTYNINWEETYNNLQESNIVAKVINLEKETSYQKTFKIKILNKNRNRNKYILLKVSKKDSIYENVEIGNTIIFDGEVQEVETSRNTGGFNYQGYLKSKKIYGIIVWKKGKIIEESENFNISLEKIKNYIIHKTYEAMEKEYADFCLALSIGYKTGLSEDVKENFSKSNLSHMLAISGMHISYLILFLNILLKPFKSKAKSIITIFLLIFFMKLTGNTPSVNRACIVAILNLFAPLVYRKSDKITNLAISAGIILIQNPYSIKDLGFIFSYSATIGIIGIYPILKSKIETFVINKTFSKTSNLGKRNNLLTIIMIEILKFIKDTILITLSANIILVPLIIYYFNSVSLLFIFSNLIAIPILTVCVILSYILLIINFLPLKINIIIYKIYSFLIDKIIFISDFFSKLSFFNILVVTPSIFTMFFIYSVIILWIYFEKNKWIKKELINYIKNIVNIKRIFCTLLIIVLIFTFNKVKEHELKIFFVDVGQGDCTLIITPNNKKVLIDGGGSERGEYDIGENILGPYLLDKKIKAIDYMIISHFDSDHVRSD